MGVSQAEEIGLSVVPTDRGDVGVEIDSLFRLHYARITSMLARLTGDRGYAEEIAADVFHKLARRPMLMSDRQDLTAWIYRVATNAGLDALRARSRRRKHEMTAAIEQMRGPAPSDALDHVLREERRRRVQDVLQALKPRDAQLLLLRAEGLAYRDLAESLGIEPTSVGKTLARAEAEFERRYRARNVHEVGDKL